MSDDTNGQAYDCGRARQAIDLVLDAEPLDATVVQQLDAHLATCSDCRQCKHELETIATQLRAMRERDFPDAALQELLDGTVRSVPGHSGGSRFRWRYAAAAAAAVLALALFGLWPAGTAISPQMTEAEMDQAARDAMVMLKITSRALRRSERAAIYDVLGGEVSGTLRRVPIDWPGSSNGTGGQRKDGS